MVPDGHGPTGATWFTSCPTRETFPSSSPRPRFPIRIEQLGLATDSGGAGYRRGGFGYDKRVRTLHDAKLLSNADRSRFGCVGVNGGRHGKCYAVSIHNRDGTVQSVEGMSDDFTVPAGGIVRIVTTGGGGWATPLTANPERVRYDVECGLVSERSAREDYGVVLQRAGKSHVVVEAGTRRLRDEMRSSRHALPMFDRGPYFEEKLRAGEIAWPEGWEDPDAECFAVKPSIAWTPNEAA